MTHDPYQTYQTVGAYPGLTNPFSSPYNAWQTSAIHAATAGNPFAANFGVPFQNAWQNPFAGNIQQHPWAGIGQHNPLIAAVLQNPVLAQLAAAIGQQCGVQAFSPYGQQAYQQQPYQQFQQQPFQQFQQPYQQTGQIAPMFGQQQVSPFGQFNTPLAPQSWVGQGLTNQPGAGQGQIHPLVLQAAARAMQTQGITPWGAF